MDDNKKNIKALLVARRVTATLFIIVVIGLLLSSLLGHLKWIFLPLTFAAAVGVVGLLILDVSRYKLEIGNLSVIYRQLEKRVKTLKLLRITLQIFASVGVGVSFFTNSKWEFVPLLGAGISFLGAIAVSYLLYKLEGTWSGGLWTKHVSFTEPLFGRNRCRICWIVSLALIVLLAVSVAVAIWLSRS